MKVALPAGGPSKSLQNSGIVSFLFWMLVEESIQFVKINSTDFLGHETFLTAYIIFRKKVWKMLSYVILTTIYKAGLPSSFLQVMTLLYRKVKELDQSHIVTVTQCDSVRLQLSFIWLESKSFSPHTHAVSPHPYTAQEGWPLDTLLSSASPGQCMVQ